MVGQQTAYNSSTVPGSRYHPACKWSTVTTLGRTAYIAHLGQQRCRQVRCHACGAARRPGRRCRATTRSSGARRALRPRWACCAAAWLWGARACPLPGTPSQSPRGPPHWGCGGRAGGSRHWECARSRGSTQVSPEDLRTRLHATENIQLTSSCFRACQIDADIRCVKTGASNERHGWTQQELHRPVSL